MQHRAELHPHWKRLPPVTGQVDVDDVLLAVDLQAPELPAVVRGGFEHLDLASLRRSARPRAPHGPRLGRPRPGWTDLGPASTG